MIRLLILSIIKFILGAESGASFAWSSKWQNKKPWYSEVPELADAAILSFMTMQVYQSLGMDFSFWVEQLVLLIVFSISYAGIQSATWLFLQWEGHNNPTLDRSSTTKPVVDFIAKKFGYALGDEGYSWIAATVKGSIICLPIGGPLAVVGGFMFALGYEIGSHFKGRVDKWFNPHIVSEGLSFVGIGLFYYGVASVIKIIGG